MKVTSRELVRDPRKIYRMSKPHPELCLGGCGRHVWMDRCRKCQKRLVRSYKKEAARRRRDG